MTSVAARCICPHCQGAGRTSLLQDSGDGALCLACGRRFPRRNGVLVLAEDDDDHAHVHAAVPLADVGSTFGQLTFFQLVDSLRYLEQKPPSSILILGCGIGREFALVARVCRQVSGLDIAVEALEEAVHNHERLGLSGDIVRFDGHHIPYRDGQFDAVMSHHVLHHVQNPIPLMSEMWRVARRDVIIHEPAATFVRRIVVRTGLRPRVETDGMAVFEFSTTRIRSFAQSIGADVGYQLYLYPKPRGLRAYRWHLIIDRLGLRAGFLAALRLLNHLAGRGLGTKITARLSRRPAPSHDPLQVFSAGHR